MVAISVVELRVFIFSRGCFVIGSLNAVIKYNYATEGKILL